VAVVKLLGAVVAHDKCSQWLELALLPAELVSK
jgi:hypothetical protein